MMRALFLALLLLNLGLFAWYRWYAQPAGANSQPAPALTAKSLQLMSELSPAERRALATPAAQTAAVPAAAPAPATTVAVVAPGVTAAPNGPQGCASYGPFPSEDAAHQAEARFKQLGAQTAEHTVAGKARLGYWVYLPPFGSRKEADAAANLLRTRGIGDLYVVTDEANRNAISLGVYNQHQGATDRLKDIRKHGFKAEITERFRDEPRFWLEARGTAAALPGADTFKDLGEDGNPIGRAICQ